MAISGTFSRNFYLGTFYRRLGVQADGWFRKDINPIDETQGPKIRIAIRRGAAFRLLGAALTLLVPGVTFRAMQSGAVDAAEWVGP